MNDNVNIFIRPILIKSHKYDLRAWFAKRKLIKEINKTSPSFDTIHEIYEFLKLLREIYMYDNNDKFHLFLATVTKNVNPNNTFAMVYKEPGFTIKFVLVFEDNIDPDNIKKQINIEIQRSGQNKNDVERISFYDGEYKFKDIYDQEKMLFITSCLMYGVVELIEYFYSNKKF